MAAGIQANTSLFSGSFPFRVNGIFTQEPTSYAVDKMSNLQMDGVLVSDINHNQKSQPMLNSRRVWSSLMKQLYQWIVSKLRGIMKKLMLKKTNPLEEHINNIKITPDDPAILMWFDLDGMNHFVMEANNPLAPQCNPKHGFFITNFGNGVTLESFAGDIVAYMRLEARNNVYQGADPLSSLFIGPLTVIEYGDIRSHISFLVDDPFITYVMTQHPGISIADLAHLEDKKPLRPLRFNVCKNINMIHSCPFSR